MTAETATDREPAQLTLHVAGEAMTADLAGRLAPLTGPGDVIALIGPLGAGKTAFARAFLRALGEIDEVPSPTFTLVQLYEPEGAAAPVHHFDFYRLEAPDDAYELGIEDAFADAISLLEWPERLGPLLPASRLDVSLTIPDDAEDDSERIVELTGTGVWIERLQTLLQSLLDEDDDGEEDDADSGGNTADPVRLMGAVNFLNDAGWENVYMTPIAGDASFRRYYRVEKGDDTAVLMDAPPEHEDAGAFAKIARHLRGLGLSAPDIIAADEAHGFLLLEDLGDATFTRELARGVDEKNLYEAAIDVLVAIHSRAREDACPDGLPPYGNGRLLDEAFLLPQWFVPAITDGEPMSEDARKAYGDAWLSAFPLVHALPKTLVLRDYHVDNMIWLPEREGTARVGLLDFQDAVAGCAAYDVMSLLEDARRDIADNVRDAMLDRYFAAMGDTDRDAFMTAFHVLGAGRHAKVIGIFTRLSVRDGKDVYLQHIPRVWRLLERAVAAEPALAPVRAWLDEYIPPEKRTTPGGGAP